MTYKHSKGFILKKIRKLKEKVVHLLDENELIFNKEFTGYNTDKYKHSEQWYRHKYQRNKELIGECERNIVELMKEYCID